MQQQLLKLIPRGLRGALPRSMAEIGLLTVWGTVLLAIEAAGRDSVTDLTDGFLLGVLGVLALLTTIVHQKLRFSTINSLLALVWRIKDEIILHRIDLGVDLRRTPEIRRKTPSVWLWLLASGVTLTAALAAQSARFPSEVRGIAASHFYVGSVVMIGLLWCALVVGTFVMSILVWVTIHVEVGDSFGRQAKRPLRRKGFAVVVAFTLLAIGAAWLPAWIPLAAYGALFVLVSTALGISSPGLEFVWQERRRGSMGSIDGRWMMWLQWTGLTLAITILVLLSRGEMLSGEPVPGRGAIVTSILGNMLAWAAIGGVGVVAVDSIRLAMLGILFNPLRIPEAFSAPCDSADAARSRRQSEIRNRRRIIRGLEKLMKRASGQTRARGTGLWIGLQHWFILGLSADEESDATDDRDATALEGIIGAPYHCVFTPEARYHFWQMMIALEIDLIFVERGLTFRRLTRVLRVLFETYDVYGGRQRAEERHFVGLPGTRVIIHDYDQTHARSHGRENYPEPDYHQIGRARILHVFKDRGETEQFEPVPDSREGVPVLSGV